MMTLNNVLQVIIRCVCGGASIQGEDKNNVDERNMSFIRQNSSNLRWESGKILQVLLK